MCFETRSHCWLAVTTFLLRLNTVLVLIGGGESYALLHMSVTSKIEGYLYLSFKFRLVALLCLGVVADSIVVCFFIVA